MKCLPYGPNARLVQFGGRVNDETLAKSRALTTALETRPPRGLVEFVPAFTSILLEFEPDTAPACDALAAELVERLAAADGGDSSAGELREIPVRYDGPDLELVACRAGLDIGAVCQMHAAPIYRVHALGFSPGFPYLGELDPRLHAPRLPTPRVRVRAGSVAIGGEHTGIYSVAGPGGWNVIGHTDCKLFDPQAAGASDDPAKIFLLRVGDRVKFVSIP